MELVAGGFALVPRVRPVKTLQPNLLPRKLSRYDREVHATAQPQSATVSTGARRDPLALFTTLARTALFLEALQEECLAPIGISFGDYAVLRLLHDGTTGEPWTPTRLAEAVVRTTGGMTKTIDRLERQGLVKRRPDPNDGRGVHVVLTAKGRRVSEEASRAYIVGRRRVLARLDEDEIETIDQSLRRLLAAFEADRGETRQR
ncbi:MAG TPA: MarR family transcriptional regulator [Acidimicrobiales bacterium]